ncbi:MAG: hypothetical protein ABIY51_05530 [Ferruginibacter sp.]
MKKVLVTITLLGLMQMSWAQSEKYMSAMKKNISIMDTAKGADMNTMLANNFERIGEAEKTQWLPYYYASFCTVINAFGEQDKSKVDMIADKASDLIDKAEKLSENNSEIYVIKSMIASARLMVDPQSRWMKYGPVSSENIQKAKLADPANPRPVYLEGQSKFYTPEAMGGGKGAARPYFEKSLALYESFKPATEISPNWGKEQVTRFLSMSN